MNFLTLNHLSDFRLIALLPVGCTTRTGRFQLFIILNRFSITFDHENGRSDRTENPYRSEFVGPNFGPNLNMSLNMSAVRILVRKSQSDFFRSGPWSGENVLNRLFEFRSSFFKSFWKSRPRTRLYQFGPAVQDHEGRTRFWSMDPWVEHYWIRWYACLIPLKRHCHQFQISVSPITNNYENRMDVSYFFISVVDLNQNEKKRAMQKSRYHSKMNKFIK